MLLLPKVIELAEDYLNGRDVPIHTPKPESSIQETYSPEERERLKQEPGDLRSIFSDTNYLKTLGEDDRNDDYYRRWGYLKLAYELDRNSGYDIPWAYASDHRFLALSNDNDFDFGIRHEYSRIGENLLKHGTTSDLRTLRERQLFYSAFSDKEFSDKVECEVLELIQTMNALEKLRSEKIDPKELLKESIKDISELYDFRREDAELGYILEYAAMHLDIRGMSEEEAGIADYLGVLRTIKAFNDELGTEPDFEDNEARSAWLERRDKLNSDKYKDTFIKFAKLADIEVHRFESEGITIEYVNQYELVDTALKTVFKSLKKLPTVPKKTLLSEPVSSRFKLTFQRFSALLSTEGGRQRISMSPFYAARKIALLGMLSDKKPFGQELSNTLRTSDSVIAYQLADYVSRIMRGGFNYRESGHELFNDLTPKKQGKPSSLSSHNLHTQTAVLELNRLHELFVFARRLNKRGFVPAEFSSDSTITIQDGWNPLKEREKQVANSVSIGSDNAFLFVTGANMSGKTNALKQVALTQLFAQSTGMVPAKYAKLPLFERIIYLDRADTSDTGKGLSAFGTEIERWKAAIEAAKKSGAATLLLADEAFSTTSPKYQEALTAAIATHFAQAGVIGAIATHNHAVVDRLTEAQNDLFQPIHFKTDIDSEGKAVFTYQLQDGHDSSKAIAVARAIGGLPDSLLSYAEEYLSTQSNR